MKFIVSSSQLLKQLQHIAGVINANTVLPILEDFLFEVEKNKLTVAAKLAGNRLVIIRNGQSTYVLRSRLL